MQRLTGLNSSYNVDIYIDGLDYDETIAFIRENTKKVDAVWQENQVVQLNAGQGDVPLMIFQGEPFFGQDRFVLSAPAAKRPDQAEGSVRTVYCEASALARRDLGVLKKQTPATR